MLPGHGSSFVALSEEGALVASGGGEFGGVCICDTSSGLVVLRTDDQDIRAGGMAFSPDGQLLATGPDDDTAVCILDVRTGRELKRFNFEDFWPRCVAFSPDGMQLAVGGRDHLKILDVGSSAETASQNIEGGAVWEVEFSAAGNILAAGMDDGTIWLLDRYSAMEKGCLKEHTGAVFDLAFSLDGRYLVSGALCDDVYIWDLRKSQCIEKIEGTTDAAAIAAGGNRFPLRCRSLDMEARIELLPESQEIAWFPRGLLAVAHPSGRTWVSALGGLFIISLEGVLPNVLGSTED